ncbi:hypothetical protein A6C57_25665 [Fibrella sp. ES10-3-2-2]|nr:hypothetical protein A6C57_25665 [Fibrella sp. ES10-3-2-2]
MAPEQVDRDAVLMDELGQKAQYVAEAAQTDLARLLDVYKSFGIRCEVETRTWGTVVKVLSNVDGAYWVAFNGAGQFDGHEIDFYLA